MSDLKYQSWEWVEIQAEMEDDNNASSIMDEFTKEQQEFTSNKCYDCMSYLNAETNECDNNFCDGKIPEKYRQQ